MKRFLAMLLGAFALGPTAQAYVPYELRYLKTSDVWTPAVTTVDGITYGAVSNLTERWAVVRSYDRTKLPDESRIVIPDTVDFGDLGHYKVRAIANSALSLGEGKVGEIVFPQHLVELGPSAVSGHSSLSNLTFRGTGLKYIGYNAFANTGLEKVDFLNGAEVGDYAFYSCPKLCTVRFDSDSPVGLGAFAHCTALEVVDVSRSYSIGDNAFFACHNLTNILISSSVTNIGRAAFQSCTSLGSFSVPSGVGTLSSQAFVGCTSLSNVTLSAGLREIGSYAFQHCTSLQSIVLPSSMLNVGDAAFGHTSLAHVEIPGSVTNVGNYAFEQCRQLEEVVFAGSSLQTIGERAFYQCEKLSSLRATATSPEFSFPTSLRSIGDYAFYWCRALTSVTMGDEVRSIGESAFKDCNALVSVRLSGQLRTIGNSAFEDCSALADINWPNTLETIGVWAFLHCRKLTTWNVPASLATLGESAFSSCPSLTHITSSNPNYVFRNGILMTLNPYRAVLGPRDLTEVVIPDGTTAIADYAFQECAQVTRVEIPNSVQSVGSWSFIGCSKVASLRTPGNLTTVQSLLNSAYNLTSVTVNPGTTKLIDNFCAGCSALTDISLPDSVTSVGAGAFRRCTALTALTLPSGVTNLGAGAFSTCTRLTEFELPDGVKELPDSCFISCSRLRSVKFAADLTRIGAWAFAYCSDLLSFDLPETLTEIGEYAFDRCTSLVTMEIPEGVRSIPKYLFEGCYRLCGVGLSSSVTNIDESAFSSCSSLVSFEMPSQVETIGRNAFYGCERLERIDLPEVLTRIGNYAFYGCKSLQNVTVPSGVTVIGTDAFAKCDALEAIDVPSTNPNYASRDGFLFDKALTVILGYPRAAKRLTVPADVTSVDLSELHYCQGLEEIAVDAGNAVYASRNGILYDKASGELLAAPRGISEVIIPAGVTLIRSDAFADCKRIASVAIPRAVTRLSRTFPDSYGTIRRVTFTEPRTAIEDYLFYGCSSLREIALDSATTEIGEYAFYACNQLFYLEVPSGVESLGQSSLPSGGKGSILVVDGPPPAGIGSQNFSSSAVILRPAGYSNEWAAVSGLKAACRDLPEEGVTWTKDTERPWAELPEVVAHAGTVGTDEVWRADKVHVVYGWVTVPNGTTVTIEPGAVVKFCKGMGLFVRGSGHVVAKGATFTHISDDEVGGDTDGDNGLRPALAGAYTIYGLLDDDETTRYRCQLILRQGTLSTDETWSGGGNVYWVLDDLTVAKGATLTLDPGAIVKFTSRRKLTVWGRLVANGTRAEPVTLTSEKDDSVGGDTDESADVPTYADWIGLVTGGAGSEVALDYTTIRYAGNNQGDVERNHAAVLKLSGGTARLNGCRFEESWCSAFSVDGNASLFAENTLFTGIRSAVVETMTGASTLRNCLVSDCGSLVRCMTAATGVSTVVNTIGSSVGRWVAVQDSENESDPRAVFSHCCFWDRTDGATNDVCVQAGTDGNLFANPKFVDAVAGDFRLQDDSPCIDAGAAQAPERDYWGQPRQNVLTDPSGEATAKGRCPDIGLYEVIPVRGALDAPDLAAYDVVAPSTFRIGDTIAIDYKVKNVSAENDALGLSRLDRFELVAANGVAYEMGTVRRMTNLRRNGKNGETLRHTVRVPAVPNGRVKVRVTVNAEHDIFEGMAYENNRAESGDCTLAVASGSLDGVIGAGTYTLAPGGAFSVKLTGGIPADTLLVLTCTGGSVQIRTASGQLPSDTYSYGTGQATGTGETLVALPSDSPYLMVENLSDTTVTYTLRHAGAGFLLYDIGSLMMAVNTNFQYLSNGYEKQRWNVEHDREPFLASNTPVRVAMRFWGNRFSDVMSVALMKDGTRIEPTEFTVFSPYSAYAVFDVAGAEPGLYQFAASLEGGTRSADKLQVYDPVSYLLSGDTSVFDEMEVANSKPVQSLLSSFPNPIRGDRIYKASFGWLNRDTANDHPVPIIRLSSERSHIRLGESDPWTSEIELVPLSGSQPADRLKPGEVRRYSFELIAPQTVGHGQRPARSAGPSVDPSNLVGAGWSFSPDAELRKWQDEVRVYGLYKAKCTVLEETDEPYPWDNNEPYNRPPDMSDEVWTRLWAQLKELYGPTWKTYATRLREQAARIAAEMENPPPFIRVDQILQNDINRLIGADPLVGSLARSVDLARPTRDASFAIARGYGTALASRYAQGLFGRGWTSPFDARLRFDGELRAMIVCGGATRARYVRSDVDSPWENESSPETDRLEGTRQIFRNGSYVEFNAEGRIAAMRNGYGEGMDFAYDAAGRLARIAHDNGASFTFGYEGDANEVASITDDLGRIVLYTYDRTDGVARLVRVVSSVGEVAYGYRDDDATASGGALNRIEAPELPAKTIAWEEAGRVASITFGGRFVTEYIREGDDLCRVVAPNGTVTTYAFNSYGKVSRVTDALGNETSVVYDDSGFRPKMIIAPSGATTRLNASASGDLAEIVKPGGGVVRQTTGAAGGIERVVDAEGGVRTFTYNEFGRPTTTTGPDGVAQRFTVNAENGDLMSATYFGGTRGYVFTYDDCGRMTSCAPTNGTRQVSNVYDALGRLVRGTDSETGSSEFAYDATNRLVQMSVGGHSYSFDYDGKKGVSRMVDENGAGEGYRYDAYGRVTKVVDAADGSQVYLTNVYDDDKGGVLTREIYGNGVTTDYLRDALGRLAEIRTRKDSTMLMDLVYRYNADGRIMSIRDLVESTEQNFTYDLDGQLTGVTGTSTLTGNFVYDAVGRRLDLTSTAVDDEISGSLVRLTSAAGDATICSYDAFGRLSGVTNETKNVAWSCAYDAFGSRVRVTDAGVTTTRVALPGTNGLLDEYRNGARIRHHVRGNGRRIAVVTPSGIRYLHCDHLGSVRIVTDENGNVTGRASFKAFGERVSASGADQPLCGWIAAHGVETDGTGFHWMQNRYYSAALGRFISEDPIGLRGGDENFRRYCGNDPIARIDANGLIPTCAWMLAAALSANIMSWTTSCISVAVPVLSPVGLVTGMAGTFFSAQANKGGELDFDDHASNGLATGLFTFDGILDVLSRNLGTSQAAGSTVHEVSRFETAMVGGMRTVLAGAGLVLSFKSMYESSDAYWNYIFE